MDPSVQKTLQKEANARILCVDNSGSTSGCHKYWEKVKKIYGDFKPTLMLYWNTGVTEEPEFRIRSTGGTAPQTFISELFKQVENYDLIVTTDGEIGERDIEFCKEIVTEAFIERINSAAIHYIGNPSSMNIGLNVIFGRNKDLKYTINEDSFQRLYDKFENLKLDDMMSPNFPISVIVKIKNLETEYRHNKVLLETKLAEFRGEIVRLFSRIERSTLDENTNEKFLKCYENNDIKEFMTLLDVDRVNVDHVSRQKTKTLNYFDKKIDFNISRITAAAQIQAQNIEMEAETNTAQEAWNNLEDVIMLDSFKLPCMLIKNNTQPIITENTIIKHPFTLIHNSDHINKIIKLVEPNPIDYTTYLQLINFNSDCRNPDFDSNQGFTKSPHTRDTCKGVFVFDAANMKCIKNNCRVLSTIFSNNNKVPGSLVQWNLVFLYILYKHKFQNTQYKEAILAEIKSYCKKFKSTLTFSHQCQVLRPFSIEICLWFCIYAAPSVSPNSAKNVLRSTFGPALLEFYMDVFGDPKNEYLKEIQARTMKWNIWNYMLSEYNKGENARNKMSLEIKAQYQKYCIHEGRIIPLKGKCDVPYQCIFCSIDATSANTFLCNIKTKSSKTDNIDQLIEHPVKADTDDMTDICELTTHVKINISTCWPYVICPITKKHWKECIGKYDIKTGSHVRLYNTYCNKYRKYPDSYMDLALLYSQRNSELLLTSRDILVFEYVYKCFWEVRETYSCEKYLKIYTEHTGEAMRLSKE